MNSDRPSRLGVSAALLVLFAAAPAFARGHGRAPGPRVPAQRRAANPPAAGQAHIKRWLANHKNLAPAEQERELKNEPGFRDLTPQMQQQLLQQFRKLNHMPAPQRDRTLDRNELLEGMSPHQQQEYRDAVQRLNATPAPRQRLMIRAIRDLSMASPDQREQIIDSPAFAGEFDQSERSTIRTVLGGEPYHSAP